MKYLWHLWEKTPKRWRPRLVYTDGYGAYGAFFSPWQHRVCQKFDGGTCSVEGVNHSLRHHCGALVRRTSARYPSVGWLFSRVVCAVADHNRNGKRRLNRRI